MDEMRCDMCEHMGKTWCSKTGKRPYQDEASRCNLYEKDPEAYARRVWLEIGDDDE